MKAYSSMAADAVCMWCRVIGMGELVFCYCMVTAHMSLCLSKKSGSELKAGCWWYTSGKVTRQV